VDWSCLFKKKLNSRRLFKEYSAKYRTVEIDSWFYRIPQKQDVLNYLSQVDSDFAFTCKVTDEISLTHYRNRDKSKDLKVNHNFLSNELFNEYLKAIEPYVVPNRCSDARI
jgi:uncharacterized protein YecE (DUF72 family)